MEEEELAQILAQQRAENNMLVRRQKDNARRQIFAAQNNLANPIDSFTVEDQAILRGAPPEQYSDADRQLDNQYYAYQCPISHEVPSANDICRWQGGICYVPGVLWFCFSVFDLRNRLDVLHC